MAQYKNNSGQGNDRLYWLIAIGLIITGGFAPIGILMIVSKLLNARKTAPSLPLFSSRIWVPGPAGASAAPLRQLPLPKLPPRANAPLPF